MTVHRNSRRAADARIAAKRQLPGENAGSPRWMSMQKCKLYKCSVCGVELPDLPMPVLQHQLSHVRRQPYSRSVPEPAGSERQDKPPAPAPSNTRES
jgi:hypothetical protein